MAQLKNYAIEILKMHKTAIFFPMIFSFRDEIAVLPRWRKWSNRWRLQPPTHPHGGGVTSRGVILLSFFKFLLSSELDARLYFIRLCYFVWVFFYVILSGMWLETDTKRTYFSVFFFYFFFSLVSCNILWNVGKNFFFFFLIWPFVNLFLSNYLYNK